MTVKELRQLLEKFNDDTEVVVTGSWQYSEVVVGSVKSFEGALSVVIDAEKMDSKVELYAKMKEVHKGL